MVAAERVDNADLPAAVVLLSDGADTGSVVPPARRHRARPRDGRAGVHRGDRGRRGPGRRRHAPAADRSRATRAARSPPPPAPASSTEVYDTLGTRLTSRPRGRQLGDCRCSLASIVLTALAVAMFLGRRPPLLTTRTRPQHGRLRSAGSRADTSSNNRAGSHRARRTRGGARCRPRTSGRAPPAARRTGRDTDQLLAVLHARTLGAVMPPAPGTPAWSPASRRSAPVRPATSGRDSTAAARARPCASWSDCLAAFLRLHRACSNSSGTAAVEIPDTVGGRRARARRLATEFEDEMAAEARPATAWTPKPASSATGPVPDVPARGGRTDRPRSPPTRCSTRSSQGMTPGGCLGRAAHGAGPSSTARRTAASARRPAAPAWARACGAPTTTSASCSTSPATAAAPRRSCARPTTTSPG